MRLENRSTNEGDSWVDSGSTVRVSLPAGLSKELTDSTSASSLVAVLAISGFEADITAQNTSAIKLDDWRIFVRGLLPVEVEKVVVTMEFVFTFRLISRVVRPSLC